MSNYTPSIGEIAELYITYRHTQYGVLREDGRAEFQRMLATVRPNPDNAWQVEEGAEAARMQIYPDSEPWIDVDDDTREYFRDLTRVMLKALAEAMPS